MAKRHYFFLLDHMVIGLKPEFRGGVTHTTLEKGLKPDSDDVEVIDLAWKLHATLVTADVGILKKCKDYQAKRKACLYGLLMLPDNIVIQKRLLADVRTGVKKMFRPGRNRPLTWGDINQDNLLVKLHRGGNPVIQRLCNCDLDRD